MVLRAQCHGKFWRILARLVGLAHARRGVLVHHRLALLLQDDNDALAGLGTGVFADAARVPGMLSIGVRVILCSFAPISVVVCSWPVLAPSNLIVHARIAVLVPEAGRVRTGVMPWRLALQRLQDRLLGHADALQRLLALLGVRHVHWCCVR